MIIAIDDSGDPGFKVRRGSSHYFAIACVFFDDDLDTEEMSLKIKRLRKSLNWNPLHEFKFRKTSSTVKEQFFAAIRPLVFRAVVTLVNKNNITDRAVMKNPSLLYNSAILAAIKHGTDRLHNAHIYIDGEAGTDY